MKLSFSHEITERRRTGSINQEMIIEVDYDPQENEIKNPVVEIYQNGIFVCEISTLLDNAEGSPLSEMLEAIEWRSLYRDKIEATENFETENYYS